MVNRLPMAKINAILTLHRQGRSQRQIAATLGDDLKTVSEHLQAAESKRAKAPTGQAPTAPYSSWSKAPTGLEEANVEAHEPANRPCRSGRSDCAAYRQVIDQLLDRGLSAKRIHQDLTSEHGFEGTTACAALCGSFERHVSHRSIDQLQRPSDH